MTLGPDARGLLDAADGADDPSAADFARVQAKLAQRLAIGASAGAAAAATAKSAAAGVAKSAATSLAPGATAAATAGIAAPKVLLAVALTVGAASTSAVVWHETSAHVPVHVAVQGSASPTATATATPTATATATMNPPWVIPSASPTATMTGTTSVLPTVPLPPPKGGIAVARPKPVVAAIASASDPPMDAVVDEAALLRSAQASLARGDSASALARLDEHEARYPHGALAPEREAARVFALCAAGRGPQARAAASAFVAASPRSPLAAQVRATCATK